MAAVLAISCQAALADQGSAQPQNDVLDMSAGALVLDHTGQWNQEWPAMALLDGNVSNGWASPGRKAYPHSFVIELDQPYLLSSLVIDNRGNDEPDYPGISARETIFYGSTTSPDTGYSEIIAMEASQGGRKSVRLSTPVKVRWLKLEIKSNYGHPMHTEIMELEAYGKPLRAVPSSSDPSGIYVTNYGRLLLTREGDRVEGCYELDTGYLYGTIDGRYMRVDWREHKGVEFGTADLVLSASGSFLNGLWYEDGELQGPWFGSRQMNGEEISCNLESAAADVGMRRQNKLENNPVP